MVVEEGRLPMAVVVEAHRLEVEVVLSCIVARTS